VRAQIKNLIMNLGLLENKNKPIPKTADGKKLYKLVQKSIK
jgi:hypothetical protein